MRAYNKKPTRVAVTQVRKETASAAVGMMDHIPTHHLPAKQSRRPDYLAIEATNSQADRLFHAVPPSEPYGARVVLRHEAFTARTIVDELRLKAGERAFIPGGRHEIRAFVACRFRYLLDLEMKGHWLAHDADQSAELSAGCRFVLGFDFNILVLAWEWVWDNQVPGGRSGRSSFDLLWCRDVTAWEQRMRAKPQGPLPDSLRDYAARHRIRGSAKRIIARIVTDAFELERACEYVAGYLKNLAMKGGEDRSVMSKARAEVSPVGLLWAVYRPSEVRQGDPSDHADRNASILSSVKLRYQSTFGQVRVPYHRCLGHDDLGYLIHVLFWMMQERTSRTDGLGAVNGSILYRLALNILAWVDDDRAKAHLVKRLRGDARASLRKEILAAGTPGVFAEDPGKSWPQFRQFVADDLLRTLGGDYVVKQVRRERELERVGLRDPRRNPLVRASYCPQAWRWPVGQQTMLDAWICSHSALQTLDVHYASPWLKTRELDMALRFATVMSETPCAPMSDFLFACDIDLPKLFAGRFIGLNSRAKAMHLGQKTEISGLPKSKKRLNSDVFGARRFFDREAKRFRRSRR